MFTILEGQRIAKEVGSGATLLTLGWTLIKRSPSAFGADSLIRAVKYNQGLKADEQVQATTRILLVTGSDISPVAHRMTIWSESVKAGYIEKSL